MQRNGAVPALLELGTAFGGYGVKFNVQVFTTYCTKSMVAIIMLILSMSSPLANEGQCNMVQSLLFLGNHCLVPNNYCSVYPESLNTAFTWLSLNILLSIKSF